MSNSKINTNIYNSSLIKDQYEKNDPLRIEGRCHDSTYSFLLYLGVKLGSIFDIFVNNKKVDFVSEEFSLCSTESGTLQFIIISDPKKKRIRKLEKSYWKQNGDENKLNIPLPQNIICTKRNFTKQNDVIENQYNKNKLWEYALFKDGIVSPNTQYPCILRHALKDYSKHVKYFTSSVYITIKSKNSYYFSSNYEIIDGDYDLVDSIHSFALYSKVITPDQCMDIDTNIRNILNLNRFSSLNNNSCK